jgi:hypothetical protein
MNSSELIECPICYDNIGLTNNITTECGHIFHASCIMTNISVNGFSCPCCRTAMVQEEKKNDYDVTDDDDWDEDTIEEVEEPFSDDSLRGLRLLTSLLEGEPQDQADIVAEFQYNESQDDELEHIPGIAPPHEDISRCLREQGLTYEQLVAWILLDHEEYETQELALEEYSGDIWNKLRLLIQNYRPAIHNEPELQSHELQRQTVETQIDAPGEAQDEAQDEAQGDVISYKFEFSENGFTFEPNYAAC